jgi:hypothetical protein
MKLGLLQVCLTLLLSAVAPAFVSAHVMKTSATLFLDSNGNVQLQLETSIPVDVLRFQSDGRIRIRTWRPSDGIRLAANGLELRSAKPLTRFDVQLGSLEYDGAIDRMYSPIVFFGDKRAVAIYSDYLLPKGGESVVLKHGGIVLGKRVLPESVAWHASQAATYIVLGQADLKEVGGLVTTIDHAVPKWVSERVNELAVKLLKYYTKTFRSQPRFTPWILLTSNTDSGRGGLAYRGDTSGSMVRLNLVGVDWIKANPETAGPTIDAFLAHEMFHYWNGGIWSPDNEAATWILEGGADAVAHYALYEIGSIKIERYKELVASSIAECARIKGRTLHEKLRAGGRAYYTCGAAAFHFASRVLTPSEANPLKLWKIMFQSAGRSRTYSEAGLQSTLEQLQANASEEASLDLIASRIGWSDFLSIAYSSGWLTRPDQDQLINPYIAPIVLDEIVLAIVEEDCKGSISVHYHLQEYIIEALPSCQRIKEDLKAKYLGGFAMRSHGADAVRYAIEQCGKKGVLELSESKSEPARSLSFECPSKGLVPATLFWPKF